MIAGGGVLYGTTEAGGVDGLGTIYSLTPPLVAGGAWTFNILHSFNGGDGQGPDVSLVMDAEGTLYGTTEDGGSSNVGNVFAFKP